MKKLILLFITMTLCFGMFCTTAQGAPAVKVTVDGKAIAFTDAKPFVDENNRTQVPMRALGEALGCNVDYYQDYGDKYATFAKTANNGLNLSARFTIEGFGDDGRSYRLKIDEYLFNAGWVDTDPKIIKNRCYLPARYVAEIFGYQVTWDGKNNTVIVNTDPNSYLNSSITDITDRDLIGTWDVYYSQYFSLGESNGEYLGTIKFNENKYRTVQFPNYFAFTDIDQYQNTSQYNTVHSNNNLTVLTSYFEEGYENYLQDTPIILINQNVGYISMHLPLTDFPTCPFKIVKRESIDISEYNSFLSTYKKNIEELYIYDVNKDNVNDLIIYTGTCEADYEYEVYTVKNGSVMKMGTIPGSQSVLYGNSAKPGLLLQYAHMGYEEIFEVTYANNTFNLKSIYQNEIGPEEDYSIPKNSINLTKCSW